MEITPARNWALCQIFYSRALDELDYHFQKMDIHYMPIKGAYLLITGLANNMRERKMDDIDILVHEKDMQTVTEYFANLEKTRLIFDYKSYYIPTKTLFYYPIDQIDIHVELHCQLNFPQRYLLPSADLFKRSVVTKTTMHLPSIEDSLLIFLCHLQSHIHIEFRRTTLNEIDVLVTQKGFNWNRYWNLCQNTGLEAFNYFMMKVYEKNYNVPIGSHRHYFYSNFLANIFNDTFYKKLPKWLKRLCFDIPFVRKPAWLLFNKLRNKGKTIIIS